MPPQHGAGSDQPVGAKVFGQQPDWRGEQRAVGPVQPRLRIGPTQDRHLRAPATAAAMGRIVQVNVMAALLNPTVARSKNQPM